MELTGKNVLEIIVGIILILCATWIISSQRRHNQMLRKKKRCTKETTGIVKDIIEVSTRQNGKDIYYTLVKIDYLGKYVLKEVSRSRSIGDIQTIYYNPDNPEDAVSELMMNEALSDNAIKGFLQFAAAFAFFIGIASFFFFVLMGYDMDYLKELYRMLMG